MKFNIQIDATPHEVRQALGLPDVEPLQQELMERLRKQMMSQVEMMDPTALMSTFLPKSVPVLEEWQRLFWEGLRGKAAGSDAGKKK